MVNCEFASSVALSAFCGDDVHVWKVPVHDISTDAAWNLLTNDERQRALAFRSAVDRGRWVVAHAALREVLRKYVPGVHRVEFSAGRFGKPELRRSMGIRFNLAHSGSWSLIAVARSRDVGVDVQEQCIEIEDAESFVSLAFSEAERAALFRRSGRERMECFYRGWTRKEAVVKAMGWGLHADLKAFDVSLDADESRVLELRPPLPHTRWTLIDIPVDGNHKAAVAVEGIAVLECRIFDFVGKYR